MFARIFFLFFLYLLTTSARPCRFNTSSSRLTQRGGARSHGGVYHTLPPSTSISFRVGPWTREQIVVKDTARCTWNTSILNSNMYSNKFISTSDLTRQRRSGRNILCRASTTFLLFSCALSSVFVESLGKKLSRSLYSTKISRQIKLSRENNSFKLFWRRVLVISSRLRDVKYGQFVKESNQHSLYNGLCRLQCIRIRTS